MINNILQNLINSKLTPQMRNELQNIYDMAMQNGNPEQFLRNKFGNNPMFDRIVNIVKGKSPEELNNYLSNLTNSLNGKIS